MAKKERIKVKKLLNKQVDTIEESQDEDMLSS